MLGQHRNAQRLAVALTGAVVALLLPPLAGAPASAGSTTRVDFEPLGHSGQGAAGACLLYRMVARDAAWEETVTAPGQAFATVTLTEMDQEETQDVDFCTVDGKGDVFKRAPRYYPGGSNGTGAPLYYNPGWTLTPEEAGNPDKARQDVPPATSSAPAGRPDKAAKDPAGAPGSNNILSLDQAIVGYDAEAGGFVFGVVAGRDGAANLSGYLDHNGDGIKSDREVPGVAPADMDAVARPVSFTPGGAPYGVAVADAVRTVVASPKSVNAVAGDPAGASLLATVKNAEGQPLVGVRPRLVAEGGPNATGTTPTSTGSCAASDSSGRSACTYSGQLPGTDQVAVFVNQSVNGGSPGRDPSEPFDVVEVTFGRAAAPPSPSPSPSSSPTPTSVPTATATGTPTETASPTPPARECATSLLVERTVMTAMQSTGVVVRGEPGAAVRLLAYSRPSTTYRVVREGTTGPDGTASFAVRPLTSTRLYAVEEGCPATPSEVLQVRSALTLGATRTGVREVLFQGRAVPARAGQLVSLYRTSAGRQVLTGQVRTDARGVWALRRSFSGTGRFGFVARTGADLVNAAGTSPIRVVDVR